MTMSSEALARRLTILKRRPAATNLSDEYLEDILNDAFSKFMNKSNRINDHDELFDSPIIDIALVSINDEGIQGMSSASEGGVSRGKDLSSIDKIVAPFHLFLGERPI